MNKHIVVVVSLVLAGSCHAFENILPLSQGLTLAHVEVNGKPHTILVTDDRGNEISGYDISAALTLYSDPLATFRHLGFDEINDILNDIPKERLTTYPYEKLLSPAGTGTHHIALGLNYAEHAAEVNEQDKPFLFLKLTSPDRNTALGVAPDELLDYEAEVCARPVTDIVQRDAQVTSVHFAFFLCGDFTDRASLIRNIDTQNMRSGKGFSQAKSKPGYFPTGPFMVIPRRPKWFVKQVEIALWHNDQRKQYAWASEMIWDLPEIVKRVNSAQQTHLPTHVAGQPDWFPNNRFTPDITLLTGTPSGVLMQPPGILFKIKHGTWYFLSGQFIYSEASVTEYVIEQYIDKATRAKQFLQPGDNVTIRASYLGEINVAITKANSKSGL
ncbi:MAG: fumarylacetoacetate hydrolase family protein [Alteromonadaceae bacterium]|nr:fumarylacetoacetate hydrolase family protein [Alteromonadaceae bacterium]